MRNCKRCEAPLADWRGETLCRECRRTVVLRDLPGDEVVLESLRHFWRPGIRQVEVRDGEAVVNAGRLRLHFEVLEDPEPIGFLGSTWVRYDHAEVTA